MPKKRKSKEVVRDPLGREIQWEPRWSEHVIGEKQRTDLIAHESTFIDTVEYPENIFRSITSNTGLVYEAEVSSGSRKGEFSTVVAAETSSVTGFLLTAYFSGISYGRKPEKPEVVWRRKK